MTVTRRIKSDGFYIPHTPVAAVVAGTPVVIGDMVTIPDVDLVAGALGEVTTHGVFAFPKSTNSGSAIAVGVKVYWDAGDGADGEVKIDAEAGANKQAGYTINAAADDDATVNVLLIQA